MNSTTVIAVQSTRLGGVSQAPFNYMNLGLSVNDEKENVIKNRALFFDALGINTQQLVLSKQVHGNKVYVANAPAIVEGYDAIVTNKKNVFAVVSIADCTPVLIYDEKNNAVAAIHAGWKGTVAKIVTNTLQTMQENYGTKGADCKAYIGACIGYENFEVGVEVATFFSNTFKRYNSEKQKWFVDLKNTNKLQLLDFGLLPENIEVTVYCTVTNNDLFFSHRKENGKTGRMMAVIGIKN
ncbi:MAG: peptidoglycan editing factor PgeF [Bacteroidia bacterium]